MSGFFKSSIGRKYAMALSAFFLIIFLIIHLSVNMTSLFSKDVFNEFSHFMGTNPLVQFAMQPILIFGVVFHFIMGFVLEMKNRSARNVKYVKNTGSANSSWMSRNMLLSGAVVLAFLVLHFIDFWIPEMNVKYIQGDMSGLLSDGDGYRYYEELVHKFENPLRVGAYVLAFVLLALHLLHGFTSAFQSIGATMGRKKTMQNIGKAYSILIPLGFIVIALFHHFNH
ncbi:MAG: succinate dehydrogenase cytochrome b subunit [Maribacter sp.]|nr:succinate dehydrogenase cytochrome b subunit [Maribacter sp.]MBT8315834.1 succinate dehydrogenase cytochrome b subunit [Maribacter sp.]